MSCPPEFAVPAPPNRRTNFEEDARGFPVPTSLASVTGMALTETRKGAC
jgi:hypothetical protein